MKKAWFVNIVTFILFVFGVVLLHIALRNPYYIPIIPALLYLWAAYGLLRQFASARYAMYLLAAYSAVSWGYLGLVFGHIPLHGIVMLVFVFAVTVFVHLHFKRAATDKSPAGSMLKEVGKFTLYVLLVLAILSVWDLLQGPTLKTLGGPVSIRRP